MIDLQSTCTRVHRRLRAWLRDFAVAACRLIHTSEPPAVIDLTDSSRRQAIREAEWNSRADAECRILRRSASVGRWRRGR